MQSLQDAMHGGEQHRLQASQQVFQDMGKSAMAPQIHEAVLADSLYRSVTERLQSGAGPASFNQVCARPPLFLPQSSLCHPDAPQQPVFTAEPQSLLQKVLPTG